MQDSLTTPPRPTMPDIARSVGVTYRQLDYWIRKGFLHARSFDWKDNPHDEGGSGFRRELKEGEMAVLELMVRLMKAGLEVNTAASVARRVVLFDLTSISLDGGITITLDKEIPDAPEEVLS